MFDESDTESAPHVALISESLARVRWPNQDPWAHVGIRQHGWRFAFADDHCVVGDTHEYSLETPAHPTIYVDIRQRPKGYFTVVMRADTDPSSVFSAARGIMRELAPMCRAVPHIFAVYSASLDRAGST